MKSIRTTLVDHLEREFMFVRPDLSLDDELDLLAEGILDSLGILRLMSFLEANFDVTLEPAQIRTENFRHLPQIVELLEGVMDSAPRGSA